MMRTVAIRLKIADNEAFTAMTALQRLNIRVARVERADVWVFETDETMEDLRNRVMHNESLFNPNKHELTALESARPRKGEVWIEELGQDPGLRARLGGKMIAGVRSAKRYTGWRLFSEDGSPANNVTVASAAALLLCNPAIERSIT